MAPKEPKLLLSVREAARLLGVGRGSTFAEMMRTGEIRVVKVAGRIKVPRSEVDRIVRDGTEPCPYPVRERRRREPGETTARRRGRGAAERLRRMRF